MRDTKDIIVLIIGSIMLLGVIYGGIWVIQRSQLSEEMEYLHYAMSGIFAYSMMIISSIVEEDKPESKLIPSKIFTFNSNLEINLLLVYFAVLFWGPALLAVLSFLLSFCLGLINNLYFIICIYFIITFLLFLTYSEKKLMNFIVFVILAIILYFGFKGRNIFRIDVKVKFNDEIIYEN